MRFRPCIDIHNGKVKQIVGGSLLDEGNQAKENFVSKQDAHFYANLYKEYNLKGGHIILLNPKDSPYYSEDVSQAKLALETFPKGLMIGGGITTENAKEFLDAGASHVIVTSYVFKDGKINYDNLNRIKNEVTKDCLTLDLSCRKRDGKYYIVTDRWQKFTEVEVTLECLKKLSSYCAEYLIHAVDVEGKANGIEEELAELLGHFDECPVTYAGGVGSLEDINSLKHLGKGKVDVTVGSALDLFGGTIPFVKLLEAVKL